MENGSSNSGPPIRGGFRGRGGNVNLALKDEISINECCFLKNGQEC